MSLSNPNYLLGLWVIPLVAILYIYSIRKRWQLLKQMMSDSMISELSPESSTKRSVVKGIFLLAAIACFWFAMAGPRFGVTFEKITRRGADIFVLLDTSRSMLAEDVRPNRLTGAKLDIEDLLKTVRGDRIGLMAFAGKPVVQVPLTTDYAFFRERLHHIDTNTAPRGGTAIGDAIRLTLRLMPPDDHRDRAIILITDGEDQESMPLEAAQEAKGQGTRIFTVSIGDSTEGARIPLFDKNGKRTGYEMFEGKEVWCKADNQLLREIAEITGGAFIPAGTSSYDLGAMYHDHLEQLKRDDLEQEERQVLREQYQIFLATGMFFFFGWLIVAPYRKSPKIIEDQMSSIKKVISLPKSQLKGKKLTLLITIGTFLLIGKIGSLSCWAKGEDTALDTIPEKYNQARKLMEEESEEAEQKAVALFSDLLFDKNAKLAARSHLNLGLLLSRDVMRKAEAPSSELEDDTLPPNESTSGSSPPNPLEEYAKERKSRKVKDDALITMVHSAQQHFSAALANTETRNDARQNLDVVTNWLVQYQKKRSQEEQQIREEKFSFAEYLQWLEQEQRSVDQHLLETGEVLSPSLYQNWFQSTADLNTLQGDFDGLERKYEEFKLKNQPDPSNQDDAIDPLQTVLDAARKKAALSANELSEYNKEEAVHSLRDSVTGLNAISSLFLSYPDLVKFSVVFQDQSVNEVKKNAEQAKGRFSKPILQVPSVMEDAGETPAFPGGFENHPKQNTPQKQQNEHTLWNNEFVNRWTDLMMQHAEREIANEQVPPSKSPEEKIRESMQLAIQLGPEIRNEVSSVKKNINQGNNEQLLISQEKILQWLKEIAKPLEEDNQDNNDQNQDNNQQNQEQNNPQDQDKDQQDQQNPPEQPKPDEQNDQQLKQSNESTSQEEMEALMRKIRQRQQEAKDVRDAVERYLRKTEKPEKDW